jgi:uncharacterized RDD family membrane protein YckC
MDNEFANVMSKKTDQDLISIVTVEKNDYQPLAVEAAESEIQKRNIDPILFDAIKDEVSILHEQKVVTEKIHGSLESRFFNHLIDFVIIICIASGVYKYVPILFDSIDAESQILPILVIFNPLCIYLGYYILLEHTYQKTVGKFATKTKVVGLEGQKVELKTIIQRTFCRLIPFNKLSFLFGSNGFHDKFSNTRVINDVHIITQEVLI